MNIEIDNSELIDAIDFLKKKKIVKRDVEIADKIGYSKGVLSLYINNKKRVPDAFLEKLKNAYPEIKQSFPIEHVNEYFPIKNTTTGTPIYDIEATAGDFEFSQNFPELIKGYINIPSFKECIAFLYVRGDSMYPRLQSGDLIGVIPVQDISIIQYGQVYLVVTVDNQRMIKYVRKAKDNKEVILRSENQHYDDIELLKDKILKLYMVKGPVRDNWQ